MSTVTSADGTKIAYSTTGDGPAVVFVDGAMCHRAFGPGAGVAEQLAGTYTVYTYDRRGRGDSGDTAPYAVEREIEDLRAVIEAAGGSARVIGVSSGAALAARAAAAGLPITKLAMFEPPYSAVEGQDVRSRQYAVDLKAALDAGAPGDAVVVFMTFVGVPAEMVEGMRAAPMWPAFEAVGPSLAYDTAVLGSAEGGVVPVEVLGAVAVPTLVMDGDASPEVLRAPARAAAAAIPGAVHESLPDQTHEVDPKVIAPVLAKFFA
ncbi:alpha/beta fold hydrolase [Yinghuangia soli]|uniref:Alpha/beta fold hydrolase n=1 Tax=Yinghuangia soli TaxID=2908204 RepID=A0AA41Q0S3_9ACTN|nr:alpha/beta hydrolase [Yinghuangia soli]MCF2528666.1 alpha/beta fold hydrolase [Yinghuangia soli]